jgi:hypothetical protein
MRGTSAAKMLAIRSHFLTLPQYHFCKAKMGVKGFDLDKHDKGGM